MSVYSVLGGPSARAYSRIQFIQLGFRGHAPAASQLLVGHILGSGQICGDGAFLVIRTFVLVLRISSSPGEIVTVTFLGSGTNVPLGSLDTSDSYIFRLRDLPVGRTDERELDGGLCGNGLVAGKGVGNIIVGLGISHVVHERKPNLRNWAKEYLSAITRIYFSLVDCPNNINKYSNIEGLSLHPNSSHKNQGSPIALSFLC